MNRTLPARAAEAGWSAVRCAARLQGRLGGPGLPGGDRLPLFRLPRSHTPQGRPLLALTFDDGPDPRWTPWLLDVLAEHQVTASFFLIGRQVAAHPALAARIAAAGHRLGNHSLDHPQPFSARPAAELRRQVLVTQELIADATGVLPDLFRAPAGGWSEPVLRLLAGSGLRAVDWSVDPKDWGEPGAGRIARRLLRSRPGDVVLCHDGGGDRSGTVQAVRAVLPVLRDRGVAFATP